MSYNDERGGSRPRSGGGRPSGRPSPGGRQASGSGAGRPGRPGKPGERRGGRPTGSGKGAPRSDGRAGGKPSRPRAAGDDRPRSERPAGQRRDRSDHAGAAAQGRGERRFGSPGRAGQRRDGGARPNDRRPEGAPGRPPRRDGSGKRPSRGAAANGSTERREPTGYAGELAGSRPARKRTKASPARVAAHDALTEVRERRAFAQDVIAHGIDVSHMKPEDRAFATTIVLGVVSARGLLDEVIDKFLEDPRDISPSVRDALRISTYEILFLGKRPHAAVDQGVELVKSIAPPAAGLANAVLRKVVAERATFPYGDPATDIDALARACAFPGWLARVLVNDLGPEAAVDLMRASNERPPLFVAVNAVKGGPDVVLRAFEKAGEPVEPVSVDGVEVPGCLRVLDPRALLLPEMKRLTGTGRILVSDAASQLVAASILPDAKPASLLEIGAGRATKTILIQSDAVRRYGSQIEQYVAVDNKEFKVRLLRERAKEFGTRVSEALAADAMDLEPALGDRTFGVVFLDAPCSGLGTLRRHPEIRWRIQPADIISFARNQLAMLREASTRVAPGGTLAYATCTVTRAEDNAVVKAFLDTPEGSDFALAPIAGGSCIATRLAPEPPKPQADPRVLSATEPSGTFDPEEGNANRFHDEQALMGSPDAHFAVRFVRKAEGA